MTDRFTTQMRAAAYDALSEVNPDLLNSLKTLMRLGNPAEAIEARITKKYGNHNLTANSLILAAYHIEANPELIDK